MLQRPRRLWATVRHLSLKQVYYRARRMARRRWWRWRQKEAVCTYIPSLSTFAPLYLGLDELTDQDAACPQIEIVIQEADAIAQRRFHFLNHTEIFAHDPEWHRQDLSQLWRYHLHYFDYVQPLLIKARVDDGGAACQVFQALAACWIAQNRRLAGDGWHPYTISLRCVNWLHAVAGFATGQWDPSVRKKILASLYGQMRILATDLEFDVRGNHLLENLRALIWAGVAFEGVEAERWLQIGLHYLKAEVAEQILADGGHFERSPGYHLVVLKDLLEIAILLRRNLDRSLEWLDAAIRRMVEYARAMTPPNQQIPLLKDTAWDAAPRPADLLAACALYFAEPSYKCSAEFGLYPLLLWGKAGHATFKAWPVCRTPFHCTLLQDSEFAVLRDDSAGDYLVFDVGKPCPSYLPAHAHADLLSYELTVGHQRVVVDSGVYEYTTGLWRDYFRSTRAHNTVEIAATNQSDVWGSFRVGRRARPRVLAYEFTNACAWIQAEHDGYSRLPQSAIHRRALIWLRNQFWVVFDQILGSGVIDAVNHIHFHPDLALRAAYESTWEINGASESLWITAFGQNEEAFAKGEKCPRVQGWYAEEFGKRRANSVLMLKQESALPFGFGYIISRRAPVKHLEIHAQNHIRLRFQHEQKQHLYQIDVDGKIREA